MAIRIQYGSVADIGKLGQLAGEAEARRLEYTTQAQLQAQQQAQAARMQELQLQQDYGREMAQFNAYLQSEADKRQKAWQVEMTELSQRHEFEMLEAKKQAEFDIELNQRLLAKQERDRKIEVIQKSVPEKISQEEADEMIRKIQLDIEMTEQSAYEEAYEKARLEGQRARNEVTAIDLALSGQRLQGSVAREAMELEEYLSNFSYTEGDLSNWPGHRGEGLAVRDSDGNWKKATPQQEQAYQLAVARLESLQAGTPAGGPVAPAGMAGVAAGMQTGGPRKMSYTAPAAPNYRVGDVVTSQEGKRYKVVGFYEDGEPNLQPLN